MYELKTMARGEIKYLIEYCGKHCVFQVVVWSGLVFLCQVLGQSTECVEGLRGAPATPEMNQVCTLILFIILLIHLVLKDQNN